MNVVEELEVCPMYVTGKLFGSLGPSTASSAPAAFSCSAIVTVPLTSWLVRSDRRTPAAWCIAIHPETALGLPSSRMLRMPA